MTTVLSGIVTPEDILSERVISDAQISPDGNLVAFILAESFKEGTPRAKSNIWLAERGTGHVRQLTSGPRSDYMPRWSPDGTKIAFLSDRRENGKFQLYVIPCDGGEASQLTDFQGAVSRSDLAPSGMSTGEITSIAWSPSGQLIAFLMYDPETQEDIVRREQTGDALEFEEHHKYGRIWTVDASTRELKRVTSDYHIWEFDWSPDGKQFAALIADEPYEWTWHIARVAVIPIETGEPREIFTQKTKQFGGLLWSQDGKTIFYLSATLSDRPLVGGDAFAIDASGQTLPVNLSQDRLGTVHWMCRYQNDRLLLYSINMTKSVFSTIQTTGHNVGKFEVVSETETALAERGWPKFSISRDGRYVAMVREDLQSPLEIWSAEIASKGFRWKKLTDFNHHLLQSGDVVGQLIEYPSFDGLKIQALIYFPPGKARQELPLIVREHGGPSTCYGYRFEMEARYYCTRGYAVLLPNPRGSQGRGVRFLEMHRGNVDGDDFKDVMAGVDYCVKQGWANPKNLFVYGGSYGGYLTMFTVSQTQRFNAAVADFGICDLLGTHGGEWNTYWEVFVFDIDPYAQTDLYDKKSPIRYAKQIKTPTLIIHGREDPCVPVTQSYEFFRALKELGIETKLVVYPGEGHGWFERKHKLDAYRRHLSWFEAHRK